MEKRILGWLCASIIIVIVNITYWHLSFRKTHISNDHITFASGRWNQEYVEGKLYDMGITEYCFVRLIAFRDLSIATSETFFELSEEEIGKAIKREAEDTGGYVWTVGIVGIVDVAEKEFWIWSFLTSNFMFSSSRIGSGFDEEIYGIDYASCEEVSKKRDRTIQNKIQGKVAEWEAELETMKTEHPKTVRWDSIVGYVDNRGFGMRRVGNSKTYIHQFNRAYYQHVPDDELRQIVDIDVDSIQSIPDHDEFVKDKNYVYFKDKRIAVDVQTFEIEKKDSALAWDKNGIYDIHCLYDDECEDKNQKFFYNSTVPLPKLIHQ